MKADLKRVVLAAALVLMAASQAQTRSPNFRIEGGSFATTSVIASSSNFTMKLTGGDGSPVGQSSSPGFSNNSGPGQTQLPTERIFDTSFE